MQEGLDILVLVILIILLIMGWMGLRQLGKILNLASGAGALRLAGHPGHAMAGHNGMAGSGGKTVVRLYSASWCGVCKFFEPTWKSAEESYGGSDVVFNKIDCSDKQVADKVISSTIFKDGSKITGYPTITIQVPGFAEEKFGTASDTVPQLVEKINKYKNNLN